MDGMDGAQAGDWDGCGVGWETGNAGRWAQDGERAEGSGRRGGGGSGVGSVELAAGSGGRGAVDGGVGVGSGGGGRDGVGAGLVDPVEFAQDVLGVTLWTKQEEALRALMRERRVAVKSGNGLGKDFTAAVAALWYLYGHNPGIVLSTAPTFRQVRHVLWRQIRALWRRAAKKLGGRMLDTRWELGPERYALGLSADEAERFQGFHSENMLVVVDEAEGVEEEIYEAVEAVMTSGNVRLLLIGNPTTSSGAFYRAFNDELGMYKTITISALESPNVVKGEVEIRGLTTAEWVEERRAMWGEESDLYRARVLGEFPRREVNALIAMEDIVSAIEAHERRAGERGEEERGRRDDAGADALGAMGTERAPARERGGRDNAWGLFLPGMFEERAGEGWGRDDADALGAMGMERAPAREREGRDDAWGLFLPGVFEGIIYLCTKPL